MEAPNQNQLNSKFRVGDTAYIESITDRWGRVFRVDGFFRIDGKGISQNTGKPIYNVTILNSAPDSNVITRTLPITYLDSNATLAPAGSIRSAGPNGGRKSYSNLKKRKSRKSRKSRKTRRNRRRRI